jgi:hypothetical protein
VDSILLGIRTVLIDMPEVLLRMKIASEYSLKELQTVFNTVANRINKK